MKKRLFILLCLVITIVAVEVSGCSSKDAALSIYGGELIKNNTIKVNDYALAYELPIVSNKKIETVTIEEFIVSGDGDYDIQFQGITDPVKYEGMYYCFANLMITVNPDSDTNFSVDKVRMLINGERIEYEVGTLKFCSAKKYFDGDVITRDNYFVYKGGKTYLYHAIPNIDKQYQAFEVERPCTIKSIEMLDFVDVNNLKVYLNGTEVTFQNGIDVAVGDEVNFEYTLSYKDGVSGTDILKTTFFMLFSDEKGNEHVFLDEQGLMIIDFNEDRFIKNYIDIKWGDKK